MFPLGCPFRSVGHPVFAVYLKGLPPCETFIRKGREDPPSVPLRATGARMVRPVTPVWFGLRGDWSFLSSRRTLRVGPWETALSRKMADAIGVWELALGPRPVGLVPTLQREPNARRLLFVRTPFANC